MFPASTWTEPFRIRPLRHFDSLFWSFRRKRASAESTRMLSKTLPSKTIQKRPTSKSRSLRLILIGGVKCHTENFYPVYGFAPFPALFDDILIITQFPIIVNNQFICLRQNHIGTPLLVPPFYRIMFLTSFSQTCLLQTSRFPPCLISGSVSRFFVSWNVPASTWNLFKPL